MGASAIYKQDKGAMQEIGDQILFEEFSFSEDYLQLQLLRIEVLIQRRRYTQWPKNIWLN